MELTKTRKISSIVITILLFFFFTFANIYSIRQMSRYAVELFFYDKALVAFQVGGMAGLNDELDRIILQDKMPREIAVAKYFKKNLGNLKSPGEFLKNVVEEKKNKINLFRHLRNVAFGCIVVLILLRLIITFRIRLRK